MSTILSKITEFANKEDKIADEDVKTDFINMINIFSMT